MLANHNGPRIMRSRSRGLRRTVERGTHKATGYAGELREPFKGNRANPMYVSLRRREHQAWEA